MAEGVTIDWDAGTFAAAVERVRSEGVIEAPGVRLDAGRVAALLEAAPRDPDQPGRGVLRSVDFQGAAFSGEVWFTDTVFAGDAWFNGATFSGDFWLRAVRFSGAAVLHEIEVGAMFYVDDATFEDRVHIDRARFSGEVRVGRARFAAEAGFNGTRFDGQVSMTMAEFAEAPGFYGAQFADTVVFGATCRHGARFTEAEFNGGAVFGGARFSGAADFERAVFGDYARFASVVVEGAAKFSGAQFRGTSDFTEAKLHGHTDFAGATFGGEARFDRAEVRAADFTGARFSDEAVFGGAKLGGANFAGAGFGRRASFGWATLRSGADFRGVKFLGDAVLEHATFEGDGTFEAAAFGGDATFLEADARSLVFTNATFAADCAFESVTCGGDARFDEVVFETAPQIGPARVAGRLWLDAADFKRRVVIEAAALRASFAGAVFHEGADIRLRWAEVWFQDADFAAPSTVAGLSARRTPQGDKPFLGWEEPDGKGGWEEREDPPERFAPRLLSLRGARVARLTLSDVDLRACRLVDAYGLDSLSLAHVVFGLPPPRWTRRRVVAEESDWRGWPLPIRSLEPPLTTLYPWPPETPGRVAPDRIAEIYRQLRKGREDRRDEPGAADFYYGEMEMRRHSATPAERVILSFYWALSGYGLRASRALLALAVVVLLVGAVPLDLYGFAQDRSYGRALLFSLESSISLLRAPEAKLTAGGELVQIVLRLAGPLFFGFALFALRARVKR